LNDNQRITRATDRQSQSENIQKNCLYGEGIYPKCKSMLYRKEVINKKENINYNKANDINYKDQ